VGSAGSRPRAISGTPAYMAPEAFEHPEELGPAGDLYAVGALGYFLLTGAHVFSGGSTFELYGQHLYATPMAPSERAGRPIPPALERLVLACLAKAPEDRPASADVLRSLLLQTESEHASTWSDADAASWWQRRARAEAPSASGERPVSSRALRVTRA
jgi:serine/threonine protein kinase